MNGKGMVRNFMFVACATLGLAVFAHASDPVPLKGSLAGTYTRTPTFPIAEVQLSGTGHATQLGAYTLDMPHWVDFSNPPPKGYGLFTLTAANGDTIFGTFQGQATPTSTPGVLLGTEQMTIQGGTGRFENASGSFVMTRLIQRDELWTVGTFEGSIFVGRD